MPVDYYGFIYGEDAEPSFDQPTFGDLVQQEQGSSDSDGGEIDVLLSTITSDLDGILSMILGLDSVIGIIDGIGDPTGDSVLDSQTPLLEANLTATSNNLNDLIAFSEPLTGIPPGTPTGPGGPSGVNQSPPPQDCGGQTTATFSMSLANDKQISRDFGLINNSKKKIEISQLILQQQLPNIFTETGNIPVTLEPGEKRVIFSLVCTPITQGTFGVRIALIIKHPAQEVDMCVEVEVGP